MQNVAGHTASPCLLKVRVGAPVPHGAWAAALPACRRPPLEAESLAVSKVKIAQNEKLGPSLLLVLLFICLSCAPAGPSLCPACTRHRASAGNKAQALSRLSPYLGCLPYRETPTAASPQELGTMVELGGLLDLSTEAQGPLYMRRQVHHLSVCGPQALWGAPRLWALRAPASSMCAGMCCGAPPPKGGPRLPLFPQFVDRAPTPIPTGSHTLRHNHAHTRRHTYTCPHI